MRVWLTDAWVNDAAEPPGLRIRQSDAADGTVTVRVRGDLDLSSSPDLEATLARLDAATRPTVLDLSAISFIDCSGLGVVLHAARTSRCHHGSFTLARERSAPVSRLIDLVGVGSSLIDDRGR